MILSRRAALGGSQLDQVDSSVVIRGMDPGTTKKTVNTVSQMGGSGQRETRSHWETVEASVTYAIDIPKTNLADRREVFDSVKRWALNKGWLTMNWMDGKRLWVDDVTIPTSGDLFRWTDEYTIGFTARSVPFWQDDTATSAEIETTDEGAGSITVPGEEITVCDAEIVNESGETINTMSVAIGESVMNFTNLGLADEEKLMIDHIGAVLRIRIQSGNVTRTAYNKRTSGSDDLYVKPGTNAIAITGGDVSAVISCYGRYV